MRRILLGALLVCGLVAAVFVVRGNRSADSRHQISGAHPHATGGQVRASDQRARHPSARAVPRFATAMPATKHDEYRTSLARAVDAKSAWASGEVRWSPTVLRLEDPAFLAERRLECGRKYGSGIKEVCNYQVDTVVERTGATEGKVVYVEARVLDEQPETGCPEFAGCIGESRRGEILPLPAGEEPLISVSQKLQSTPLPDYMKDPKHLQKLVAHFQAANERARVQVQDGDLKVVHAVTDRENAIRYMQRKLAAMELER